MMETKKIIKWYPAIELGMIPEKEGRRVSFNGHEIALFNLGSEYLAVDNRCPHKQGPLSDGIISGKAVFCPLHNLKINLKNGCAMSGGKGQVKTYPVKTIRGKVYVAFEEGIYQNPTNQECSITEPENLRDIN